MISIAEFFTINRSIIYFIYGLVFFILGIAITLQTRRSSNGFVLASVPLMATGIRNPFLSF